MSIYGMRPDIWHARGIRILGNLTQSLLLCAIEVYEIVDRQSLAEVERRFDWTSFRVYGLNDSGKNHGRFLESRGWVP